MCGRFTQKNNEKTVEEEFDLAIDKTTNFEPSYNIAPSQLVGAIRIVDNAREYTRLKWGLIPHWSKDDFFASKLINARAETLAEKPSFRDAYRNRRCLIPASGFYEWEKTSNGKQPHYFYLKEKDIFGFGGLWEEWLDKETGELVETFTIITTEANKTLEPIHHRMPVIIASNDYEKWLEATVGEAADLLKPYSPKEMDSYRVSKAVNLPINNSVDLTNSI